MSLGGDNDLPADYPDAWLASFRIIMTTTAATDDVGHVHDRMPMIVVCENWADRLDPRLIDDDIRALLAPPPVGSLDIHAVTKAVNNVRNNAAPNSSNPCRPSRQPHYSRH
jgi:putative SOS response-associated peptidase YedK